MTTIKSLSRDLKKALEKTLSEVTKPSSMQKLGNELKDDIVKRTRLGYGADRNGGQRQRFEPLSKSYIEQRRGKLAFWTNENGKVIPVSIQGNLTKEQRRRNKDYINSVKIDLDGTTRASKSNLTQTGDMLDKLGVVSGVAKVTIGFKTSKAARKASFVSKKRPFMFATKQQINRLNRSVRKLLDTLVSKNLNF